MTILLTLAIIIIATKIADSLAIKVGLPAVIGSLLIGIVLGPALLNLIQTNETIELFSDIGVILLMFLAGLESDLKILKKYFKPSLVVGLLGVFVPLILFTICSNLFGFSSNTSLFIGLVFGATSLSITIQVLKELHYVQTKEGSVIIGAAILDDIIVIILLNIMLNTVDTTTPNKSVFALIMKNVLFFVILLLINKFILPVLLAFMKRLKAPEKNTAFALFFTFALSYFAYAIGMSDIIGAFFAGVMLSQTKIGRQVERKIESITLSLFAPVFFVSIGLNLSFVGMSSHLLLIVVFSLLALVSKFLGGFLGGKINGFSNPSSAIIGTSLISRGEMALILVSLGMEKQLLTQDIYAAIVLVVIISTILAPILLKNQILKHQKNEKENALST